MVKTIQLYGGPKHGQTIHIRDGLHRFEVMVYHDFQADSDRYRLTSGPVVPPMRNRATYYLQPWGERAITEAGSVVRREVTIGVWEHGKLLPREEHELRNLMREQPWIWEEEPNILTHFHRWWEKAMHENGWKKVWVH